MASGRVAGLSLWLGITTGSRLWSVSDALGLGTLMQAKAWVFDLTRDFGATCLMFVALKSARSKLSASEIAPKPGPRPRAKPLCQRPAAPRDPSEGPSVLWRALVSRRACGQIHR